MNLSQLEKSVRGKLENIKNYTGCEIVSLTRRNAQFNINRLASSCISGSTQVTVHAIEVSADPKSPRFGAGPREDAIGLYVDWAVEDSGLCKGDRFVLFDRMEFATKHRATCVFRRQTELCVTLI